LSTKVDGVGDDTPLANYFRAIRLSTCPQYSKSILLGEKGFLTFAPQFKED
jgi:hypothetical protein